MTSDYHDTERRAMQPCDKGPALERIEGKLNLMTDLLVAVAEQKIDTKYVHKRLDDHEDRLKYQEKQPVKKLAVIYSSCAAAVVGVFLWLVRGQ